MTRVLVLVEGQTEERFFNQLLAPHLGSLGIAASCTQICTRMEAARRSHRGGHGGHWAHVERDIRNLLRSKPAAVTTLLDLYGFPRDLPGHPSQPTASALAAAVEAAVADPRFFSGILVHEFEALLLTDPAQIVDTAVLQPEQRAKVLSKLQADLASQAPEAVDGGRETAPSKRLIRIVPDYDKALHGPRIAESIGLARLRAACPHFDAWLVRVEQLRSA